MVVFMFSCSRLGSGDRRWPKSRNFSYVRARARAAVAVCRKTGHLRSPRSIVTQIYYDRAGRQIAVLDANGNLNRYERDAAGNITRELHADGGIVQNSYTGFGEKNSVINEILDKTSYTYDTMGRLVLTEKMATVSGRANAEACTNTLANNSFNNTATSRALTKVASYVYDEAGRRISETNGNEETTNYRFDRSIQNPFPAKSLR